MFVNDPSNWVSQTISYWVDFKNLDKINFKQPPSLTRTYKPRDGLEFVELDYFPPPAQTIIDLVTGTALVLLNAPRFKDDIGNTDIKLLNPDDPLRTVYFKLLTETT